MATLRKYLCAMLFVAVAGTITASADEKDEPKKPVIEIDNIKVGLTIVFGSEALKRESAPDQPKPPTPKPPSSYPPKSPVVKPLAPKLIKPIAPAVPPVQAKPAGNAVARVGKGALRIGGRLLPWVGWGLLAYDAYENRTYILDAAGNVLEWFSGKELPEVTEVLPEAQVTMRARGGDAWEFLRPIVVERDKDVVAVQTHTGYLSVNPHTGGMAARASEIGEWEKFKIVRNRDGTISIFACARGKYLSAAGGGGGALSAIAEEIGAWEKFVPAPVENEGLYLHVCDGKGQWWCLTVNP